MPSRLPEKTDHLLRPEVGGLLEERFIQFDQGVVVLQPVESMGNAPDFLPVHLQAGEADHGGGQAVFFHDLEVGRIHQVDRSQPHFLAGAAEVLEGDLVVTPFAGGVVDVAFEARDVVRGFQTMMQAGRRCGNGCRAEKMPPGKWGGAHDPLF